MQQKMRISTEAQIESPSQSNTQKQINTILTPEKVRKQFNITIACYKSLNNTHTTIDFLQNSLKSRIIPPTFVIKNTFYNSTDTNAIKIRNILHQTSTTLIKITIDSLKTKEQIQFKHHLKELHTLLSLIPDKTDQDLILDKLAHMESIFRHKTIEKSIQRLHWLKQKEHQPIHTDAKENQQTQTNTNKHKSKDKKHRRFVKRTWWRNIQKKKKSEQITAVYNYSNISLTSAMSKVPNRGLNFYVTLDNLNVTEMLVDYRKFERKMRWKEFFHDKEEDDNIPYIPPIFP
jgi:hypothetical protein